MKCFGSEVCIPTDWFCDGEFDCEDESDDPLSCVESHRRINVKAHFLKRPCLQTILESFRK